MSIQSVQVPGSGQIIKVEVPDNIADIGEYLSNHPMLKGKGKTQLAGQSGSKERIAAMQAQSMQSKVPDWGSKNPELYGFYGAAKESLPLASGLAAGAATGGASLLPAAGAMFLGGAAGQAGKQIAEQVTGDPNAPKTSTEAALNIAKEGGEQALFTLGGGAAAKGLSKAVDWIGTKGAERIMNSLVKPKMKEFLFGKNPGRVLSQEGIVANSMEGLESEASKARERIGGNVKNISNHLDDIAQKKGITLDTSKAVDAFDKAIAKERGSINFSQTAIDRLETIKSQIAERSGKAATFNQAYELKKAIGEAAKWGANISDDKIVNKALKQAYGLVKSEMNSAANKVDPEMFRDYAKLNEKYADITAAESAIKNRAALLERQDMISMPGKLGATLSTVLGAIEGGVHGGGVGAGIGAALGGTGMVMLDKLMASPAAKTRIASALSQLAPESRAAWLKAYPPLNRAMMKSGGMDVEQAFEPKLASKATASTAPTVPKQQLPALTTEVAIRNQMAMEMFNKPFNELTAKQAEKVLTATFKMKFR